MDLLEAAVTREDLRGTDTPAQYANFVYPANFVQLFNVNTSAAMDLARQGNNIPANDSGMVTGPYLLYCKGVHPRAITQLFLSDESTAHGHFYWLFSSANIDFLSIPEAARLLFSKAALPEDTAGLKTILSAFGDAYVHANEYSEFTPQEVGKVALAGLILSMSKGMSEAEFMQLLVRVEHAQPEFKESLFAEFREKPIPLSFKSLQVVTEPDFSKVVMMHLRKKKKKSKRFVAITKASFVIYKDAAKKELDTEIPLFDVNAKVAMSTNGKEDPRLVIARNDGNAFCLLKPKAMKKGAKDFTYELISSDLTVLRLWAGYINFITTRLVMQQLAFGAIAH